MTTGTTQLTHLKGDDGLLCGGSSFSHTTDVVADTTCHRCAHVAEFGTLHTAEDEG